MQLLDIIFIDENYIFENNVDYYYLLLLAEMAL